MFGNKRTPLGASSETHTRKRRDGRGFGPFASGHLTIIVVTLVIVVAFPFAAFAVTGSNVFVTDATSGTHAKVDSGGHVLVGDGSGALTVDGTINARAALPTKPIVITPIVLPSSPPTTIYGPVSKPFAIGSVTLTSNCGGTGQVDLFSNTAPGGDFDIQRVYVAPLQTLHLTFPIPLVTTPPAGGTASLKAQSPGCVTLSGVGYQT